ncbi:MAG: transposase [Paenibacillus sp.]|nr:transposase [Paenibacillus sp.]
MTRKIESRGYKLMYLSPYLPELNTIEQFWAILKGNLKCHKLLTEETCLIELLRHVMPYLLKFYTTLPVSLNDKSFNVIIEFHSKRFEVKTYMSFLGQLDLTYSDISLISKG